MNVIKNIKEFETKNKFIELQFSLNSQRKSTRREPLVTFLYNLSHVLTGFKSVF